MYHLPITELKSQYSQVILNSAVRGWGESTDKELIPDKIDSLQQRLERASKKEFIKLYNVYVKGEKSNDMYETKDTKHITRWRKV